MATYRCQDASYYPVRVEVGWEGKRPSLPSAGSLSDLIPPPRTQAGEEGEGEGCNTATSYSNLIDKSKTTSGG